MDKCCEPNCDEATVESKGKLAEAAPSGVYCWKHLVACYDRLRSGRERSRLHAIEREAKMKELRRKRK
jgi:hypothetical protein